MEDKKFYWLKLKNDFFKRQDIMIVENMPNGKDYILFYLKMLLESVSHNGELRFNDTIPYNEQMLATITNTNIDIVRSAMEVFTSLNMIEVLGDDTIYMTEVEKMIGSSANNDNANRQRRFREKKKQEKLESVTKCNALVTDCVTKDNESIDIEIEKDKELETDVKKERKKASTFDEVLDSFDYIRDNSDLRNTFLEFIKMRKLIKKPLTDFALKKIINESYKLGGGDTEQIRAIVEQSVMNSWQGVFPLKEKRTVNKTDFKYVNPFTELLKEEGYE